LIFCGSAAARTLANYRRSVSTGTTTATTSTCCAATASNYKIFNVVWHCHWFPLGSVVIFNFA
jgi:hypothetical protein